jgi:hypothetical protein
MTTWERTIPGTRKHRPAPRSRIGLRGHAVDYSTLRSITAPTHRLLRLSNAGLTVVWALKIESLYAPAKLGGKHRCD